MSKIIKRYYQLQILYLSLFKPTVLFEQINELSWYKNSLRKWFDDLHIGENKKVLEVGCATGALTNYIEHCGGYSVGADYSESMIEIAKHKYPDCYFLVADVHDLPFENEMFDAVIATSLINIIDDKNIAITELSRCCKKGGVVSVLVPSDEFTENDFSALLSSIDQNGFSTSALQAWNKKPPKMSANEMINLFEQANLEQISVDAYLSAMLVSVRGIKPEN